MKQLSIDLRLLRLTILIFGFVIGRNLRQKKNTDTNSRKAEEDGNTLLCTSREALARASYTAPGLSWWQFCWQPYT